MQTLSTILSFDVPDSRDQPSAIMAYCWG